MEVYVLVPVRKTVVAKVVGTLMLVLAVVSLLGEKIRAAGFALCADQMRLGLHCVPVF